MSETDNYLRADVVNLRGRVNELELKVAKNGAKLTFISALTALAVSSLVVLVPSFL